MSDDRTIDERDVNDGASAFDSIATLSIRGMAPVEMRSHVTIGRDPKSADGQTIEIAGDPLVSKSHLVVDFEAGALIITDLGSSNGTFLHRNGVETAVPTDRWITVPDDAEIEFGDQRMYVTLHATAVRVVAPTGGDEPDADAASADDTPVVSGTVSPTSSAVVADAAEVCVKCARALLPDAKFCEGCGTPVAAAPSPLLADSFWATTDESDPLHAPAPTVVGATVVVPPGATPAPARAPAPLHAGVPVQNLAPTPAATGGPNFVDPARAESKSGGAAKRILGVLAAVVVIGLVAFGLTRVIGRDDDDSQGGFAFDTAPTAVDEQWSESVSGDLMGVGVVPSGVIVVTSTDDTSVTVTSFALDDGREQWEVVVEVIDPFFSNLAGEFDDIVVVHACGAECSLFGLDRRTGAVEWDDVADRTSTSLGLRGRLLRIDEGTPTTLELLDPADGTRIERVRGDDVEISAGGAFLVTDGDEVEVFDADLESVFGPVGYDSDATAAAFTGSRLVVAVDDELRLLDESGDIVAESRVDADTIGRIDVIDDDNLLITTGDGVMSVDPVDGDATTRWSASRVEVWNVYPLPGDTVVVVFDVDGPDGEALDAETGDRRFTIDDLADVDSFVFLFPARNAAIVSDTRLDTAAVGVRALDWRDGDELWDERFDGQTSIGRGVLVEITQDGDVTLFR